MAEDAKSILARQASASEPTSAHSGTSVQIDQMRRFQAEPMTQPLGGVIDGKLAQAADRPEGVIDQLPKAVKVARCLYLLCNVVQRRRARDQRGLR